MNEIHETAIISDSVKLGSGNVIGPYVVISGQTQIGDNNWFGAGVVIGSPPEIKGAPHQSISSHEDMPKVDIGSENFIREGVSIQGSLTGVTKVGSRCFIMTRAYIAHDCEISDDVIISANTSLAGHCKVGKHANIGLASAIHQRIMVGNGAMVGMNSTVTKNVPPLSKTFGSPARVRGANVFVLKKLGALDTEISEIEAFVLQSKDFVDLENSPKSYLKYLEKQI